MNGEAGWRCGSVGIHHTLTLTGPLFAFLVLEDKLGKVRVGLCQVKRLLRVAFIVATSSLRVKQIILRSVEVACVLICRRLFA